MGFPQPPGPIEPPVGRGAPTGQDPEGRGAPIGQVGVTSPGAFDPSGVGKVRRSTTGAARAPAARRAMMEKRMMN